MSKHLTDAEMLESVLERFCAPEDRPDAATMLHRWAAAQVEPTRRSAYRRGYDDGWAKGALFDQPILCGDTFSTWQNRYECEQPAGHGGAHSGHLVGTLHVWPDPDEQQVNVIARQVDPSLGLVVDDPADWSSLPELTKAEAAVAIATAHQRVPCAQCGAEAGQECRVPAVKPDSSVAQVFGHHVRTSSEGVQRMSFEYIETPVDYGPNCKFEYHIRGQSNDQWCATHRMWRDESEDSAHPDPEHSAAVKADVMAENARANLRAYSEFLARHSKRFENPL